MILRDFTEDDFAIYHGTTSFKYPPKIGKLELGDCEVTVMVDVDGIHFYLVTQSSAEMTWTGINCPYQIGILIADRLRDHHANPDNLKKEFGIKYENAAEDDEEDEKPGFIILP